MKYWHSTVLTCLLLVTIFYSSQKSLSQPSDSPVDYQQTRLSTVNTLHALLHTTRHSSVKCEHHMVHGTVQVHIHIYTESQLKWHLFSNSLNKKLIWTELKYSLTIINIVAARWQEHFSTLLGLHSLLLMLWYLKHRHPRQIPPLIPSLLRSLRSIEPWTRSRQARHQEYAVSTRSTYNTVTVMPYTHCTK